MEHETTKDSGPVTAVVCIADEVFRDAILNVAVETGLVALSDIRRGNQIVDLAASVEPAVLVLDLTLTGVDGLAVIGRIREVVPRTVIVVVSPFPTLPIAAIEDGASHMVSDGDVAGVRAVFNDVAASAGNHRTNAPSS